MHPAIADKKEQLSELCRRYEVVRLEVFESAARATDFNPDTSDADFLVEFDPNGELSPLDALHDVLRYPVDLVEDHEFRNPYLRASINAHRELVYAA